MIRIAHFSDLHYGPKKLVEADRCFGFAIEEAIRRGVDVAVVSGDATDHALDVHSPAVAQLASRVRQLAEHCPVLMLQGTFSHEPPGTLSLLRLLGGRHPVHVADRLSQVALMPGGAWRESPHWCFEAPPAGATALFTCVPTVNKASVAASVGAAEASEALGEQLAALLAGYAPSNEAARREGVPTVGVSHGTVSGCLTEHGVPMAGFDHEFTTGALFAARTQAFMLGHIHRHQHWEEGGRVVAYAGSIGRFHHGEEGDKGFVVWNVGADGVDFELAATPARRTVDVVFEGPPDMEALRAAAADQGLAGAWVRVRWTVADEDRHGVDQAAMRRVLAEAAGVQLEGRIVPVTRARAPGISSRPSLEGKVATWAAVTGVRADALLDCLAQLGHREPHEIAAELLAGSREPERPAPAAPRGGESGDVADSARTPPDVEDMFAHEPCEAA